MKRTLTIAGGGLAGLSLGIALRSRGVPVRATAPKAHCADHGITLEGVIIPGAKLLKDTRSISIQRPQERARQLPLNSQRLKAVLPWERAPE